MDGAWIFACALAALSGVAAADTCGLDEAVSVQALESRLVNGQIQGLQSVRAPTFVTPAAPAPATTVTLHSEQQLQKMNGFGAALTESCAMNLQRLPDDMRAQALVQLFSKQDGAGFDYLRVPIGASDFADGTLGSYTYDDSPGNLPDPGFTNFDMTRDEKSFALIRAALAINPRLRVLISPWSPPAWMKLPTALNGGILNPAYYPDFARYFVRVVEGMRNEGVPVDSLTIQNEPGYPNDIYPSMGMSDAEMITFLRDFLIPELHASGVRVGIYVLDHNWDMYADVNAILDDPVIHAHARGVAYHCYTGDPTDMQYSTAMHPDVPTFQTECTGVLDEDPEVAFTWWFETYAMGTTGLGSTGALAWNLCLDQNGGPTNNGCETCSGVITTDFSASPPKLVPSPEYFALAQMSRAITPGMHRIAADVSNGSDVIANAFAKSGARSVVLWNPDGAPVAVRVQRSSCSAADFTLGAQTAVTLTWDEEFVLSDR